MKKTIIYIHGKGGNSREAEHYKALFSGCDVIGIDYEAETPWRARDEFSRIFDRIQSDCDSVSLIANSIGAYFALKSLYDKPVDTAYFISPVVNMEKLITDMLIWAGKTENDLCESGEIETDFGETLSWKYLEWVRNHPTEWKIPTHILYGEYDNMQSIQTITEFAGSIGADVTVMPGGEHWFHTDEQMKFLDEWITEKR